MATPDGWQSTTYGAVFTEIHERRGDRVDLPVLSVTKTRGPMLASERFGKALHGRDLAKYRIARRGTFVADPMLLWDGTIGRQEAADCGLVSPDYRVYELAEHVASEFMRYVVRDPRMLRHYQGGARGTNVRRNRIARGDFLRIPFALPPFAEQRRIAAILYAVDEVIEKTEAVIENLKTLKMAMMEELLTRGLPGQHTRSKQTEIGEVPEAWKVVRMADLAPSGDMVGGPFGSDLTASDYVRGEGVPVIRGGNISPGRFDETDFVYVSPEKARLLTKNSARPGDIVMTQRGASFGQTALIPYEAGSSFYIISQTMMRMRPDIGEVLPEFLVHFISSTRGQAWLQRNQIATGQPHINLGIFREMPTPLPPIAEQTELVAAVASADARLFAEECVAGRARATKAALMSVLLAGELRVTPDQDPT